MASKKKTATVTSVGIAAIVAATQAGNPGYLMVPTAEAQKLAADGLVELNTAMTGDGTIATRATQKGIDSVNTNANTNPAPVGAEKPKFVIEDNVSIPAISGRGRIGSVYPFDELKVGQSFFVPKAAKNLASTVSSANARYAEETGETRVNRKGETVPKYKFTRQFIVRSVEGGSRIWRKA